MASGNALLTGPSSVAAGGTSTNFTITPAPAPITGSYALTDGGFGGTFTPPRLSWIADATPQTFVYNAPATPGLVAITPVWYDMSTQTIPVFLLLNVLGANPAQHIYYNPQQAGVPPFQIVQTNNQIPGANVVFVAVPQHIYYFPQVAGVPPFQIIQTNNQIPGAITPPPTPATATIIGTTEAATGTIAGIGAAGSYTLMGPWQTPFRISLKEVISVQATGTFNLDYQFTTDFGTTWYPGPQVVSSTSFADGTAYTQRAHMKIEPGFFWRIQVYNTSGVTIDAAFERRFVTKGSWGT